MSFYVYLLATIPEAGKMQATYVGATVDIEKRLRQHNGELKGGARRTSMRPGMWYRICFVKGFESWKEALQFEWRWKWFSRKQSSSYKDPLERRALALEDTLVWWMEQKGVELEVVEDNLNPIEDDK